MKKLAARTALGFVALYAIYLLGMNALLLTPIGLKLANLAPDTALIRYDRAWTWLPLRVHATNFYFRYQDAFVQMELTAEQGTLTVIPHTLLTRRTFRGTHVVGDGVTLKLRQWMDARDATPAKLAKLPPIDGLPLPVRKQDQPSSAAVALDAMVAVELADVRGSHIREVWVDEYRLTADMQVRGGFFYRPFQRVRVDDVELRIEEGALSLGQARFADQVVGRVRLQLDEMDIVHFEREALAGLDADVALSARVRHVRFLNYYLRDIPQVRLRDGAGLFRLDARIERGLIATGSRFHLDTQRVVVDFPYFTASGNGKIRWQAREKTAWLSVGVRDLSMALASEDKVYLRGPQLGVTAVSSGLDLSKPLGLDLVIDVPDLRADDLTFLNGFIPRGTGVHIKEGKGTVRGHLEIEAPRGRARGNLEIDGARVSMQQKDASLRGRVTVRGKLNDLNLNTGAADLSGSTLTLDDVVVDAYGVHTNNFWVHVGADRCKVNPRSDLRWDTELSVHMKNLQPLMRILATSVEIPWAVQAFSALSDLQASAGLLVRPTSVELHKLRAQSSILDVEGNLRLLDQGGQRMQPFGAVLVRFGALRAAVELNGKTNRSVLLGAERWFNTHPWGPGEAPAVR